MILVCGEALIDFTPVDINGESGFLPHPGGSPYNVSITLGRLGAKTSFFGKLSFDPFGDLLYLNLEKNSVDTSFIVRGEELTTLAFVIIENNEPQFIFYGDRTADTTLAEKDIPKIDPEEISLIHFGSISLVREPGCFIFEKMMEENFRKTLISLDPNVRPFLIKDKNNYISRFEKWVEKTNILKTSLVDIKWLYPEKELGEIVSLFFLKGVSVFIVTLGKDGSIAFTKSGKVESSGIKVDVVDTVGAGDAFMGGFLYFLDKNGILKQDKLSKLSLQELREAIDFANVVSAITCTKRGAESPFIEEVNTFIDKLR